MEVLRDVLLNTKVERGTSGVTGEWVFDIRVGLTLEQYLSLCALAGVEPDRVTVLPRLFVNAREEIEDEDGNTRSMTAEERATWNNR